MKKHLEKITVNKYFTHIVVAVCVSLFLLGMAAGEYKEEMEVKKFVSSFKNLRDKSNAFQFINPLMGGVSAPATDIGLYKDIKKEISAYLFNEKRKGKLHDYSFYFRELSSPLWYGVNEEKSFTPASLFKLPIAIIVYKQSEADGSLLKKTLVYTQEMKDANQRTSGNEASILIVGRQYSVEELVKIMIEFSDNGAKDLLSNVIEEKYVSELFTSMDLVDPILARSYEISSRKYAFFLRILYNGGYLKKANSEYLLSLLAKSAFKDGLVAGVPNNIVIAHKFGVHDVSVVVDGKEEMLSVFSDCGIVYREDNPYAICVMTQGKSIPDLLDVVSHVSKMVYEDEENKK